jgi:hypothetical protein
MTSIYDLMNFTGGACSLKRLYSICDPTPTYADERAVMIAYGNYWGTVLGGSREQRRTCMWTRFLLLTLFGNIMLLSSLAYHGEVHFPFGDLVNRCSLSRSWKLRFATSQ